MKFKLQCEWTPQQIFFCGDRVLRLSVIMKKQAMLSSVVRFQWVEAKKTTTTTNKQIWQIWSNFTTIDEAGNFQVVVIRREKNSSIYLNNFTNFFNTDAFFHFLWKMPAYLVADAKPVLCAEQSIMLLAIGKMFLNLNFISNNFQETYDLNFDRFSNYLYLFKKSA